MKIGIGVYWRIFEINFQKFIAGIKFDIKTEKLILESVDKIQESAGKIYVEQGNNKILEIRGMAQKTYQGTAEENVEKV